MKEKKESKAEQIEKENSEERKRIEDRFKEIEKKIKENTIKIPQLYVWFKEEIDRKDKEIQRLKKDNHVLFMTALKANQNSMDYTKLVNEDNEHK